MVSSQMISRRDYLAMLVGVLAAPVCWSQKLPAASAVGQKSGEAAPKVEVKSTLENLMAAYHGESNAQARYLAFAKKADEEGYGAVASLFRAASRAESILARNHAKVIKAMGGAPKAELKASEVKPTKENLQASLAGENFEWKTMYPAFLKKAREDKNRNAIRTFNFAIAVESGHAKLYREALNNLETWKGGPKVFFVCNVCGNTVPSIDFKKCPVCMESRKEYVKVI